MERSKYVIRYRYAAAHALAAVPADEAFGEVLTRTIVGASMTDAKTQLIMRLMSHVDDEVEIVDCQKLP